MARCVCRSTRPNQPGNHNYEVKRGRCRCSCHLRGLHYSSMDEVIADAAEKIREIITETAGVAIAEEREDVIGQLRSIATENQVLLSMKGQERPS